VEEDFCFSESEPPAYFCAGGAAGWAGGAGLDCVGVDFTPERTDPADEVPAREARTESVIEVSMKTIADHVVAFERAVAAPRGPKAV